MKNKLLLLPFIWLLICCLTPVNAQEAIVTSGDDAAGSGGTVSYSVGQVVFQTYTGTNGSTVEGAQQPYEISVVTGIQEVKGINLKVLAYPNPAADYLILQVKDIELSNLSYQLYDIRGKLLQNEKITGNVTSIVMSNLASTTYFLKVTNGKKEIETFKIIKTQ